MVLIGKDKEALGVRGAHGPEPRQCRTVLVPDLHTNTVKSAER